METRYLVLALVVLVTLVLVVRGVVGLLNGEIGTVARQFGVGIIIFAFGVALVRHWDEVG
jgi:hypothetical protein